jgi:2-C-methyl-D-erythritol 4-phosphate cytidylyltransferase
MDVIILGAGKSSRMGKIRDRNKVYMNIFGHPAIMYPIFIFSQFKEIIENGKIIITYCKGQYEHAKNIFNSYKFNVELVEGGDSRQESVYNALKHAKSDKVLIHDGARVCVSKKIVKNMIDTLNNHDAVVVGIKATDTLKRIEDGIVKETLNREKIYKIQTPQGFKTKLIIEALISFKNSVLPLLGGATISPL